jgi:hypothetical protein
LWVFGDRLWASLGKLLHPEAGRQP